MKAIIYILIMLCFEACALGTGAGRDDQYSSDRSDGIRAIENAVPLRVKELLSSNSLVPDVYMFKAHDAKVNALSIALDGSGAYSGGADGKVIFSSIVTTSLCEARKECLSGAAWAIDKTELLRSQKAISALSLSSDGRSLAVAEHSLVVIFDLPSRRITSHLSQVHGRITTLSWDPRGELVAIGTSDGGTYVWNVKTGKAAGEDSKEAIETYPGAKSAIANIVFHPSGRAFFSAHSGGMIYFWRLLRTEREMRLRDVMAEVDATRVGYEKKAFKLQQLIQLQMPLVFASMPPTKSFSLEDIWLDDRGAYLFAATSEGGVYKIKVRGLKLIERIAASNAMVSSISGKNLKAKTDKPISSGEGKLLLISTGREPKLKFWCVTESTSQNVAETELFSALFSKLSMANQSSILWAGQKTGNLSILDIKSLSKSPQWGLETNLCRDAI
ncbi:MAG: hypothetical protein IT291_09275 [Deltaproteobacteria bacterium]|nr:hypothetical protein [Deltaproteobacteria bacterium]